MTREIPNKPHRTPHPDGPHSVGTGRGGVGGQPSPGQDEVAADELNYDSCMDDLNLILSQPLSEPDPLLKSRSSSDTIPRLAHESEPVPPLPQERGKPPRTSEIFKAVGPRAIDVNQPRADRGGLSISPLIETSPDPETMFEGNPISTGLGSDDRERSSRGAEWASDDDQAGDARLPWPLVLIMSYASAVTLALTWVLWTGRSFKPEPPVAPSQNEAEMSPKMTNSSPVGALPPLPAENVVTLGATICLGDLEATPIDIVSARLSLARAIEPSSRRREVEPALVLRIKFKNVSSHQAFAPLEPRFLREQTAAPDRSSIATPQGVGINLFPLAVDSEWTIVGQAFPTLQPGETMETIIASEPNAADRLTDDMTWRIRLRTGPYKTDVLGVRFSPNDVEY